MDKVNKKQTHLPKNTEKGKSASPHTKKLNFKANQHHPTPKKKNTLNFKPAKPMIQSQSNAKHDRNKNAPHRWSRDLLQIFTLSCYKISMRRFACNEIRISITGVNNRNPVEISRLLKQ